MAEKTAGREDEDLKGIESLKNDLYFWLQAAVTALVGLILVFTLAGRIIGVDGTSMVPTLHDGDRILLQSIGYTPKRGDVVVLTKSFANITQPIVKRVIAVGGQRVDIDYNEGLVYVDGVALDEPYINEAMHEPGGQMVNNHLVVPEGSIFVMGDNRNASSDSRHALLGTVDERYVLGHALFIVFPLGDFGAVQ